MATGGGPTTGPRTPSCAIWPSGREPSSSAPWWSSPSTGSPASTPRCAPSARSVRPSPRSTTIGSWPTSSTAALRQSAPYAYGDLTVSAASRGRCPARLRCWAAAEVPDFGAVYLDFPPADREAVFQAVIDGTDRAPLQAALISWDSEGLLPPTVTRFDLANAATGGTVNGPAGFDRHTLAVWARGTVGSDALLRLPLQLRPRPSGGRPVPGHGGERPFYPYVAPLLTLGVVSGREVPAGSGLWFFAGKENVLREQFAKMIMEAIGLHTPVVERLADPSFSDVRPVYDRRLAPRVPLRLRGGGRGSGYRHGLPGRDCSGPTTPSPAANWC